MAGETSVLSWSVEGADTVTIEPLGAKVDAAGSMEVEPAETTEYRLIATNRRGETEAKVTVHVWEADSPPLIVLFEANPSEIVKGSSSTLVWHVVGADNISISPGIGEAVESVGSRAVSPPESTTYELTASNAYGRVNSRANVIVTRSGDGDGGPSNGDDGKPVVVQFTAEPEGIDLGGRSLLRWEVKGATSVTISPDVGSVDDSGSKSITPRRTTTYTLRAANERGTTTREVTVHVRERTDGAPLIARFTAEPTRVERGGLTTLSWAVVGANEISIDKGIGSVSANGSTTTRIDNETTFTLTARNASGTVRRSVTVSVREDSGQEPFYPVVAAFIADPPTGSAALTTTLYWQVLDPDGQVDSVTLTFGDGSADGTGLPTSGSREHTYGSAGVYVARLELRLKDGTLLRRSTAIGVTPQQNSGGQTKIHTFTARPTHGSAPLDVEFSWTASADSAQSCTIDFGDGSAPHVTSSCDAGTVGHTYSKPGVYLASLLAQDEDGNLADQVVPVFVLPSGTTTPPFELDFTAAPAAGDAPLDVAFSWTFGSAATERPEAWLFFGDGSQPVNTSSTSAQHTYTEAGAFRAVLVALAPSGDVGMSVVTINVFDPTAVPTAVVRTGSTLLTLSQDEQALLAPLLSGLLGEDADLAALDNQSLLDANVNLLELLQVIALNVGATGPAAVLAGTEQLTDVIQGLLELVSSTTAAGPLTSLLGQLPTGDLPLALGELINVDPGHLDVLSNIDLQVLDILVLALQLFNAENVVGTPTPIVIGLAETGGLLDLLGLSGIGQGSLSSGSLARIYLQVVEPPVLVFARTDKLGSAEAGFRSAGVRLALELEGLGVRVALDDQSAPDGLLNGLFDLLKGLLSALSTLNVDLELEFTDLSLYGEAGAFKGYVDEVNLDQPSVTLQASGALANLQLGSVDLTTFFDRSRSTPATVEFGTIAMVDLTAKLRALGLLEIAGLEADVAVLAKGSSEAQSNAQAAVVTGPYPATKTTSSAGLESLISSLLSDLELDLEVDLKVTGDLVGALGIDQLLPPLLGIVEEIVTSVLGLTTEGAGFGASLPLGELLTGVLDSGVFKLVGVNFDKNHISVLKLITP